MKRNVTMWLSTIFFLTCFANSWTINFQFLNHGEHNVKFMNHYNDNTHSNLLMHHTKHKTLHTKRKQCTSLRDVCRCCVSLKCACKVINTVHTVVWVIRQYCSIIGGILPSCLGLHSENKGSTFFSNVGVITQKTKVWIFTAVKTSYIRCADTVFGAG
jgi:hypothetical protein